MPEIPPNVTCTSCRYFVESRHYGQLEESRCRCAYDPELVPRRPETPACHNYEANDQYRDALPVSPQPAPVTVEAEIIQESEVEKQ